MIVKTEEEMLGFGRELAQSLCAGDFVTLDGPLGAGKTVLCRGILSGLGFSGEVASPSYALVHQYDPPAVRVAVAHADLYRLQKLADLEELGLDDGSDDCITLIEWAKNAGERFSFAKYQIQILPQDDGSRIVEMKSNNG